MTLFFQFGRQGICGTCENQCCEEIRTILWGGSSLFLRLIEKWVRAQMFHEATYVLPIFVLEFRWWPEWVDAIYGNQCFEPENAIFFSSKKFLQILVNIGNIFSLQNFKFYNFTKIQSERLEELAYSYFLFLWMCTLIKGDFAISAKRFLPNFSIWANTHGSLDDWHLISLRIAPIQSEAYFGRAIPYKRRGIRCYDNTAPMKKLDSSKLFYSIQNLYDDQSCVLLMTDFWVIFFH